jgi:hypothetical protein
MMGVVRDLGGAAPLARCGRLRARRAGAPVLRSRRLDGRRRLEELNLVVAATALRSRKPVKREVHEELHERQREGCGQTYSDRHREGIGMAGQEHEAVRRGAPRAPTASTAPARDSLAADRISAPQGSRAARLTSARVMPLGIKLAEGCPGADGSAALPRTPAWSPSTNRGTVGPNAAALAEGGASLSIA